MRILSGMEIKKAIPSDAEKLSDLTIRSKSYWKYGDDQIEKWKSELTITSAYILTSEVYNLFEGNKLMAYYAYFSLDEERVKLDNMFIHPDFIGRGFGNLLMNDFIDRARRQGYKKVELDADPNAEEFYKKLGFKSIGKVQSSIKNRFLPTMEKDI